jgi:hypothetical protein
MRQRQVIASSVTSVAVALDVYRISFRNIGEHYPKLRHKRVWPSAPIRRMRCAPRGRIRTNPCQGGAVQNFTNRYVPAGRFGAIIQFFPQETR